jgi:hypothetical protein
MKRTIKQRAAARNNFQNHNSIVQSRRRRDQLQKEELMAQSLRRKGYEVFSPTVVCDRIMIRDKKVFFVEFKKPGQVLRPGQQRVKDLSPSRYLVFYK